MGSGPPTGILVTAQRTIVVPCFNEASRLDVNQLLRLSDMARATILAVDDGSTDATACVLSEAARAHPGMVTLHTLATNRGKGEAVRRGLIVALDGGADLVGYYDADMSTPIEEMARLVRLLDHRPQLHAVLGARVALLGHDIHRSALRHYLGRVFATFSSAALGLPVYDTQCGAKAFRVGPALRSSVVRPFRSRWAFDVELLGRLRHAGVGPEAFLEVPLWSWRDMDGSKLGPVSSLSAAVDLARVAVDLRSVRRARS
jgi:dolichyl-phosphate beta-glucosyltransferase